MSYRPPQVEDEHRARVAAVYIRQSSFAQVRDNVGSALIQRDLVEVPKAWGWPDDLIEIRDDLGASAHEPGSREEFERLLRDMESRRIGAVFVVDHSRLGRNEEDQARFMSAARRQGVLLSVRSTLYDFRDPNSSYTAAILGFGTVREHRVRIGIGREAKQRKAAQGLAPSAPPVGFIRTRQGPYEKTTDDRVREVIQLVWDKILEIRSGRGVVRYLRENNIQLPRRSRGGAVVWKDAEWNALSLILRNPVYSGTYIYGKSRVVETHAGRRPVPVPSGEWIVKAGLHPGYVTPEQFQEVQQLLKQNHRRLLGPVGRGEALLQGLLRCALHGRKLKTLYHDRERGPDGAVRRAARYICVPTADAGKSTHCHSVRSRRLDPLIEREFFERFKPPTVDEIERAFAEDQWQFDALARARDEELRRAERQAAAYERDFLETDAGQRHVKDRLRTLWEAAQRRVEELRAKAVLEPLQQPRTLNDAEAAELRMLLSDLPRLWRHPNVTDQRRKTILRMVIREITINAGRLTWCLTVSWARGDQSELTLPTRHGVQLVAEQQHLIGRTDEEISAALTDVGAFRPCGLHAASPYTAEAARRLVRRVRKRHQLDRRADQHINLRFLEGATYQTIADELNAALIPHYLGRWTRNRVRRAVGRMRRGSFYGLPVLPPPTRLRDDVEALAMKGFDEHEILAELNQRGSLTAARAPLTVTTIRRILKNLGLSSRVRRQGPAAAKRDATIRALWAELQSVAAVTARANELGIYTRCRKPWRPVGMARKLMALGVRQPRRRRGRVEIAKVR
jgi:DNA invertase Pin-like site-specific DNA recombinase